MDKRLTFIRNKEREEFYINYSVLYRQLYNIVTKTVDESCRSVLGQKMLDMAEKMWGSFVEGATSANMNYIRTSYKHFEILRTQTRLLLDENLISSGHHQILIERFNNLKNIYLKYINVYLK